MNRFLTRKWHQVIGVTRFWPKILYPVELAWNSKRKKGPRQFCSKFSLVSEFAYCTLQFVSWFEYKFAHWLFRHCRAPCSWLVHLFQKLCDTIVQNFFLYNFLSYDPHQKCFPEMWRHSKVVKKKKQNVHYSYFGIFWKLGASISPQPDYRFWPNTNWR